MYGFERIHVAVTGTRKDMKVQEKTRNPDTPRRRGQLRAHTQQVLASSIILARTAQGRQLISRTRRLLVASSAHIALAENPLLTALSSAFVLVFER